MEEDYVKYIGLGAGVLTSSSMLPQLIKTFKEKKAEEISLFMILILMSGIGGWIFYGVLRNDAPIIYTNSFSFILNSILLILRFKYADKK